MSSFDRILVCEEKSKKFILDTNGFNFSKEKLDDNMGNLNRECDYLITNNSQHIQIFVELKGNKVEYAFKQILSSYQRYKTQNSKAFAGIVSSSFPKKTSSFLVWQKSVNNCFRRVFIKNKILETKYNPNTNEIEKIN